ncbi:MAG: hypothetical protein ACKPKO_49895, partial [Candidatus Fonsibacter sp.]
VISSFKTETATSIRADPMSCRGCTDLKNDGMDLQTYYNYMKNIKDSIGVNYDIIVAEFINKWF